MLAVGNLSLNAGPALSLCQVDGVGCVAVIRCENFWVTVVVLRSTCRKYMPRSRQGEGMHMMGKSLKNLERRQQLSQSSSSALAQSQLSSVVQDVTDMYQHFFRRFFMTCARSRNCAPPQRTSPVAALTTSTEVVFSPPLAHRDPPFSRLLIAGNTLFP